MNRQPLAPVRRDAALALWRQYTAGRAVPAPEEEDPPAEQFGDSAALADELLGLVLAGTKRATAGLVADFAWDEGEGDRNRDSWLRGHERYFRRTQAARGEEWSDDLEVVFERFRVVWPPEVTDRGASGGPAADSDSSRGPAGS